MFVKVKRKDYLGNPSKKDFTRNHLLDLSLFYSLTDNSLLYLKLSALSNSSKFWYDRGGFKSKVISKIKTGQVHFKYNGNAENLEKFTNENK